MVKEVLEVRALGVIQKLSFDADSTYSPEKRKGNDRVRRDASNLPTIR